MVRSSLFHIKRINHLFKESKQGIILLCHILGSNFGVQPTFKLILIFLFEDYGTLRSTFILLFFIIQSYSFGITFKPNSL